MHLVSPEKWFCQWKQCITWDYLLIWFMNDTCWRLEKDYSTWKMKALEIAFWHWGMSSTFLINWIKLISTLQEWFNKCEFMEPRRSKVIFFYQTPHGEDMPFIISIQTKWMLHNMVKYVHNSIIVTDSTFNTNKYGVNIHLDIFYILTIVLISSFCI